MNSFKILYDIRKSEIGDTVLNRFIFLINRISISAVVEENGENRDQYRCQERFHFNQEYTWYEYEKWINSFVYIIHNHTSEEFNLICEIQANQLKNIQYALKYILPNLKYEIRDLNEILIKSKDCSDIFNFD